MLSNPSFSRNLSSSHDLSSLPSNQTIYIEDSHLRPSPQCLPSQQSFTQAQSIMPSALHFSDSMSTTEDCDGRSEKYHGVSKNSQKSSLQPAWPTPIKSGAAKETGFYTRILGQLGLAR